MTASQTGERLLFQGNDCQREKRNIVSFFFLLETKTSISFHLSQKRKKIKLVFTKMSEHYFNIAEAVSVREGGGR